MCTVKVIYNVKYALNLKPKQNIDSKLFLVNIVSYLTPNSCKIMPEERYRSEFQQSILDWMLSW